VMGKDVVFTFGPLGFLEHTRPISQQLIYSSTVFWAVLSFILYFNLLRMVQDTWHTTSWLNRGIALLAVIVLGVFLDDPIQRLMLLVYVLTMRSHMTGKASLLLIASAVASISLMVKFSHGVTTFAFLGIYWLGYAITHKNARLPLQAAMVALLVYWLLWLVIYPSFSGSVQYILMGLDFSRGSISAMALAPEHNSWAILGFYALYLGGLITLLVTGGYKRHALLALPFLGPLLIWTRYAFGREDISHLVPLYCFAFHTWLVLLPYIQPLLRKVAFAIVMGCTLPVWYYIFSLPVFQFIDMQPESTYHTVDTLKDQFNIREQIKAWQFKGKKENSVLQLPDDMRKRIGKETADIYPWQAMISAANTFDWKPRPVFQNYITYTPKLDALNADFLASKDRPAFYVWHREPFQDIDNRYPFSANPLTLESILRWYKPVMHNKDFHLLESVATPQLSAPVTIQQETHAWNTWIPLPDARADIIKANLSNPKTVLGKIRTSLWKSDITFIDYKLDDGRVVSHRLVLDNASNGIWAAPYITDISPAAEGARPIDAAYARKLLESRSCKGYIENVSMRAGTLRLDGWAACLDRDTDRQEVLILMHGPEASYLIPANSLPRPGITDYFKLQGQFNLENSGFSASTAMDSMRPGTYTAYMLTRVDGDIAISDIPRPDITITQGSPQPLNVKAIRLRSKLGWTFQPEFQVEWTAAYFLGDRKYF